LSQNYLNIIQIYNIVFVYLEIRILSQITIKFKIYMSLPQKYYSLYFFAIGDFTLRLLKKHRKNDSAFIRFVYVARSTERENK